MRKSKLNLNSVAAPPKAPNATMTVALNGSPKLSENDDLTVLFEGGQEITNGTVQKDGTYYDIPSLDVDSYSGKVYDDHEYGFRNVLGKVIGLVKDVAGDRVTIGGIKFSKANPYGMLARDMLLEGLVEFSTGTLGATEDDGRRFGHRLIDTSIVGLGNNDYTMTNLAQLAASNGFDLAKYNLNNKDNKTMKFLVYNVNSFAVKVKINDANGDEQEVEVPANGSAEVPDAEAQTAAQKQVDEAKAPEGSDGGAGDGAGDGGDAGDGKGGEGDDANQNQFVKKSDFDAVVAGIADIKKNMNTPAKPDAGSHVDKNNLGTPGKTMEQKVKDMKPGERLFQQIMLERNGLKNSDEYRAINDFNTEQLVAKNYMEDTEASVGGLIPPYELLDKIMQCETKYDDFLSKFAFQDAGLSYGWNLGIGDIEFTPLGYCAPSAESDFETALQNRTQERLATHTVICNKVSRFSPANVVNLVAGRYQTAYKRALAQFVVAELQVAVDARVTGLDRSSGTDIAADPTGSLEYPVSGQKDQAAKILQLFTDLSDCVTAGTYVMNAQTAAKLILDFNLGASGILSNNGTVTVRDYSRLAVALGGDLVVVPNSLMPTLGTDSTVTVPRTSDGGGNVTVDHAIFYVEPADNWYGVTNGALQFDVDSFGSYEVTVSKSVTGGGGGTVSVTETRSAKQRGETVLFGEMYRGGGILDFRQVGGVKAAYADES